MKLPKRIRLALRSVHFWWQRRTRGWDDSETWNLDTALARLILPRLKRFREIRGGFPGDISDQVWDKFLEQMIASFEFYASDRKYDSASMEEYRKAEAGLYLFGKYFGHLWD